MTAIDFAMIVIWRTANALLTTATEIPLLVLLAVAGWPLFDSVGVRVPWRRCFTSKRPLQSD